MESEIDEKTLSHYKKIIAWLIEEPDAESTFRSVHESLDYLRTLPEPERTLAVFSLLE